MMDKIKKLRDKTGAGVMDVKKALEEAKGDMKKAEVIIRKKGLVRAVKKSDREVKSGLVYSYVHQTGKVGALIEIACETDFVAKNDQFVNLCKEVAMQVASMNPKNVKELEAQSYIRDSGKKVGELVKELVGKTGENMRIVRFTRYELGEI
ncbi:translation elongation factor Ts [Patescibacteria group bacterium]|nr:translation elongation factor Ts [Patescibacteria group bacterium]MBU1256171.1 translation elongation factor Ts [Patescibacteria group bacterium]MBU1457812.1 translation elongation factor Ts [Patescibacteria group bacterium]